MATATATARATARATSTTGAGTRRSLRHQVPASMPWDLAPAAQVPAPAGRPPTPEQPVPRMAGLPGLIGRGATAFPHVRVVWQGQRGQAAGLLPEVVKRDGAEVAVTRRASASLLMLMSRTPPFPEVALEPLGGRYEVVRPLGIGRTTMVFEACDREEDRRVALKVPVRQFAADEAFLARLQGEVEAVAGFDHPNVAAVHGFERDGPAGFVVVELVEGSTLGDMLATRGHLPSAGAARTALQVCAALDAAHARGLTHGHLTLANILLRIDGRVKLTAFRLAQAARPLAAAPDPEGDLRALGRCMVVMLTGAEPAPGERVRLGPEVPAELAAIVVKAAGDHQNGYRSTDDLGRDLARFLAMVRRSEAPVSLPGAAAAHDPPDGAAADFHQAIEPKRSLPGSAEGDRLLPARRAAHPQGAARGWGSSRSPERAWPSWSRSLPSRGLAVTRIGRPTVGPSRDPRSHNCLR